MGKLHYEQRENTSHRLENIFSVHITDNILVARMYKEF
jgi:hypothetical protein